MRDRGDNGFDDKSLHDNIRTLSVYVNPSAWPQGLAHNCPNAQMN